MGPAAGGAVYSPALTDFIFMTAATSYMFVTGPNVVKQVLNETISPEELGGASVHAVKSGVADFVFNDDENTLRGVKMLLSYLPSNNIENAPYLATDDPADRIEESLRDLVPEDPDKPYDVRNIIRLITDKGKFLEIAENYAPNIIIGLARFGGYVTGIVANQPQVMAGTLDMNSSVKAARFINFCDSFNIPILTLEDVPGFLPGADQEHAGIIRHGAKIIVCLHPGYCTQNHRRTAKILRRSLYRYEQQRDRWRLQLCLADSRNRCHGTRRGNRHSLPQRTGRCRRSRCFEKKNYWHNTGRRLPILISPTKRIYR